MNNFSSWQPKSQQKKTWLAASAGLEQELEGILTVQCIMIQSNNINIPSCSQSFNMTIAKAKGLREPNFSFMLLITTLVTNDANHHLIVSD